MFHQGHSDTFERRATIENRPGPVISEVTATATATAAD